MATLANYLVFTSRNGVSHDLTGYVQGFQQTTRCQIGRASHLDAVLTLSNQTGDFTPAEGGGTGTFATWEWFNSEIVITLAAGTSDHIYEGLVTDFRIIDDGVQSIVTLTCEDWLSVTQSNPFTVVEGGAATEQSPAGFIYAVLNGSSGFGSGASTPLLGYSSATYLINSVGATNLDMGRPAATNVRVLDYINSTVLAPLPGVLIPHSINASAGVVYYTADWIGRDITRDPAHTFTFAPNPTGTELPAARVEPGFDRNAITSNAEIDSGMSSGPTGVSASNATTANTYGTRGRYYRNTGHLAGVDTADAYGALQSAEFWIDRQANARYVPRRLTFTVQQVETLNGSAAAIDELELLLSAENGVWQPAAVTYTPTGGSSVTVGCVITGRTINATPGSTTVTLDLLPAADYGSFVLDSTVLGVLGGVGDTYDSSSFTYDASVLPYNGRLLQGNRLG